jgi:hypothetical protein
MTHILFLDESFARKTNYAGYGGFCVDASALPALATGLAQLKKTHSLPDHVEMKWSIGSEHPMSIWKPELRHEFYAQAIRIMSENHATVMCGVVALEQTYGLKDHDWSQHQAETWAKHQLLRLVAERFETPYLKLAGSNGLIVCDLFRGPSEPKLIDQFSQDLRYGTSRVSFNSIVSVPLMTSSARSPHLQFADLVVGIVVQTLAGSTRAKRLFDSVAHMMLRHPDANGWDVPYAVIHYGLKLFPDTFTAPEIFASLNETYRAYATGLVEIDPT